VHVVVHERDKRTDLALGEGMVGNSDHIDHGRCRFWTWIRRTILHQVDLSANPRSEVAVMESHRLKADRILCVLETVLMLTLERCDVCAVPSYGLSAHGAQPSDLRLFGHGKPRPET
jgi:hypothetical protein